MPIKPATLEQHDQDRADASVIVDEYLPYLPPDLDAQRAAAYTDLVFGFTARQAGERNGLSPQQCERLISANRAQFDAAKAYRKEIMANMLGSLVYAIVTTGLRAVHAIDLQDRPLACRDLQALASAGQMFAKLASDVRGKPIKPNHKPPHDAQAALAELRGIQDVVVGPPKRRRGRPPKSARAAK